MTFRLGSPSRFFPPKQDKSVACILVYNYSQLIPFVHVFSRRLKQSSGPFFGLIQLVH